MKVSDFSFDLPDELIAQFPPKQRTDSRLLKVFNKNDDNQIFIDDSFSSILCELEAGDLVVLNNTKVIPARLFGQKDTGGRIEILIERVTSDTGLLAQVRASKAPKVGQKLHVDGDEQADIEVVGRQGMFFVLQINLADTVAGGLFDWLEQVGHMPLPPYIERADDENDQSRYQTVFAEQPGAVAAPTAGLHYDDALLQAMQDKGVQFQTVTLHVGAGTYQPVRVDTIDEHVMHSEAIEVKQEVCDAILATKAAGKRVMAVGTTVVRSLESAAQKAQKQLIEPYTGETDIFIYPGYEFKVIDLLQTNFHLPESTLLMLVSAFAGYEKTMRAYQHAIEQKYRFFSYGDAMLLEKIARNSKTNSFSLI